MTNKELKYCLQKEILKRGRFISIMYLCDSIGCSYNGLQSFLRRPSTDSIDLKVITYLINEGVIELKGGVQDE